MILIILSLLFACCLLILKNHACRIVFSYTFIPMQVMGSDISGISHGVNVFLNLNLKVNASEGKFLI